MVEPHWGGRCTAILLGQAEMGQAHLEQKKGQLSVYLNPWKSWETPGSERFLPFTEPTNLKLGRALSGNLQLIFTQ